MRWFRVAVAALGAAAAVALAAGEEDPAFAPRLSGICDSGLVADDDLGVFVGVRDISANHVVKLKRDGSRDLAWGANGSFTWNDDRVFGIPELLEAPDGGLFIVAFSEAGRRVVKVDAGGRLDREYGTAGLSDAVRDLQLPIVFADGSVAGLSTDFGRIRMHRLQPDGRAAPQAAFSEPLMSLPFGDVLYAWGVAADGHVQIAHYTSDDTGRIYPRLARYPGDVPIGGGRLLPTEVAGSWTSPAVKVLADGALLIGHVCEGTRCPGGAAAVSRFAANAAIDTAFGGDGMALLDYIEHTAIFNTQAPAALLTGPDGSHTVVIRWTRWDHGFSGFRGAGVYLARVTREGRADAGFPNGRALAVHFQMPLTQSPDGALYGQDGCRIRRFLADTARLDATVVEYYHPQLDHYFMTAAGAESALLDAHVAEMGWRRTGARFGAWLNADVPGAAPLCRFYGDLRAGPNSHFYTAEAFECQMLVDLEARTPVGQAAWRLEGRPLAVAPAGESCRGNLTPVRRLYNRGFERGSVPNHRYITTTLLYDMMQGHGWAGEGVRFCATPPIPSSF